MYSQGQPGYASPAFGQASSTNIRALGKQLEEMLDIRKAAQTVRSPVKPSPNKRRDITRFRSMSGTSFTSSGYIEHPLTGRRKTTKMDDTNLFISKFLDNSNPLARLTVSLFFVSYSTMLPLFPSLSTDVVSISVFSFFFGLLSSIPTANPLTLRCHKLPNTFLQQTSSLKPYWFPVISFTPYFSSLCSLHLPYYSLVLIWLFSSTNAWLCPQ